MDAEFIAPSNDLVGLGYILKEVYKIPKAAKLCKAHRACIQAGGNVGVFPIHLASYFESVYTFEPDAENYRCLCRNIASRNINNILPTRAGLGEKASMGSTAWNQADNCGTAKLTEAPSGDCRILFVDSWKIHNVDLIYLDVEGAEYKALLGARETIARCKPVLIVENNGLIPEYPANKDGSFAFRDFVTSMGYTHVDRWLRDDVFIPA